MKYLLKKALKPDQNSVKNILHIAHWFRMKPYRSESPNIEF